MSPNDPRKNFAVWKDGWLPPSETFIRDQLDAMTRWNPVRLGFVRTSPSLQVTPRLAPYSTRLDQKVLRLLLGTRLHRRAYREICEGESVRLIHAHFGQGGVHALSLARGLGIPLVVTFHGKDASTYGRGGRVADVVYGRALRNVFEYASRLIAVSDYVARQLRDSGAPPEKIEVIYTGTSIPEAWSERPRRPHVLFVGRLIEQKGVFDLLDAMEAVQAARPEVSLVVVGDGPLRSEMERQVRDRQLHAEFAGMLDSSQVGRAMEAATVMCAPSRRGEQGYGEGFGMVFAEAAARALPVVAYGVGGVLEAVQDGVTGLLVAERDVQALGQAILDLLHDPGRAEAMGRAGRERAERMFDLAVQSAHLERLYDEVTGA